jgi:hypothetical protein
MKQLLNLLFALLLGWSTAAAQPRISLLTCSPGDATYSLFGHSAIRVQDTARGLDQVYNYGTFDFNTPNFYGKFLRGRLLYELDIQRYDYFLREYEYEGRWVYEEEFLLDTAAREAMLAFLIDNYRPENRYYHYDFFFDNCSSRIRDALEVVLQDRLQYRFPVSEGSISYREAIDPYLTSHPWLDLGIDLLLGSPADRVADERGLMFLPDHLSALLAYATIDGERPLLGPRRYLVARVEGPEDPAAAYPAILLWALFPGFLLLWGLAPPARWARKIDVAFWILMGLAGCLVAFMWLGTEHQATQRNWNLLWLHPLYLLVGIGLLQKTPPRWLKPFGWIQLGICGLLLISWLWLPQSPPAVALPLILVLGFQSGRLAGLVKKGKMPFKNVRE